MQIFFNCLWHSVWPLSVLQTVLTIQREDSVNANCDKLQDYFFLIGTREIVHMNQIWAKTYWKISVLQTVFQALVRALLRLSCDFLRDASSRCHQTIGKGVEGEGGGGKEKTKQKNYVSCSKVKHAMRTLRPVLFNLKVLSNHVSLISVAQALPKPQLGGTWITLCRVQNEVFLFWRWYDSLLDFD